MLVAGQHQVGVARAGGTRACRPRRARCCARGRCPARAAGGGAARRSAGTRRGTRSAPRSTRSARGRSGRCRGRARSSRPPGSTRRSGGARTAAPRTAPRSARSRRSASRGSRGSRSSGRRRSCRGTRAASSYSPLKPSPVRSPETITTSGSSSLISTSARSSRLGTKCGEPQWRSESCAIVTPSLTPPPFEAPKRARASGPRPLSSASRTRRIVARARHVVHAHDQRAAGHRRAHRGERPGVALGRRPLGERADEVLSRHGRQHRPPERRDLRHAAQQLDRLGRRLRDVESGVEHDRILRHPGRARHRHPLLAGTCTRRRRRRRSAGTPSSSAPRACA